ncbi:hypothetical protein B0E45_01265 [Sinorhizobium sp. A49]|uniref:hypothetical protein n=1 Tax=Sinorhizobium sp. A49 TaxID=1945861 RepID=UPI000984CC22|nr:hypothetical protein [Sinorhizobium sp. A49]OOG75587.1 hypothetical protein B0E45_01265 [Sinorhizobium sp. A49]
MTDRPILFSTPMVHALLAGTKKQTRRLVKFAGIDNVMDFVKVATDKDGQPVYEMKDAAGNFVSRPAGKGLVNYHFSPRIGAGDRLWVRETWQGLSFGDYLPTKSSQCEVRYAATDPCADLDAEARGYPWRPSIFMPRWASRLTLIVTDVRVERLQDISEADAIAEGVEIASIDPAWPGYRDYGNDKVMNPAAKGNYRTLWDHINGAGAWTANPWVVAYTFRVIRQNIDQIKEAA